MSRNNKARRAAKQRARRQRGTAPRRGGQSSPGQSSPGQSSPGQSSPGRSASGPAGTWAGSGSEEVGGHRMEELWSMLLAATHSNDSRAGQIAQLLLDQPRDRVIAAVESSYVEVLGALWRQGWQPAEVRRHIRRTRTAAAAHFVEVAILAFHDRLEGVRLDPRWQGQLHDFTQRHVATRGSWFVNWWIGSRLDLDDAYLVSAGVLSELGRLPVLDLLMAAPGVSGADLASAPTKGAEADPKLQRIRSLLAKAESTPFEEEAAALTSKAQELMTRYAIDHSMLADPDPGDVPRMARIPIDAPYVDQKAILLGVVAAANRCRSITLGNLGLASAIGHADDLTVTEMLFTSLLVQAQNALAAAGRRGAGSHARSQSFKQSFFMAYASRIAERLDTANAAALDELPNATALLPVLRSREQAVEDFIEARYGDSLQHSRVRGGYDVAGATYGRQTADRARLNSGELAG